MTSVDNPLPGVPIVESPLFDRLVGTLSPEAAAVARRLHDDGFAVIDFPEDDFDRLAEALIARLEPTFDLPAWRRKKAGGHSGGLRIQDSTDPLVRRIAGNPRIIELLSAVYGRPAFPFQILNFPVGTEQHFHTDAIHFSSVPERFMCGVWVALEDIGPDQGPLVYYPGSHRLPIFGNEHFGHRPGEPRTQEAYHEAWERMVEVLGLERRTFCPRRGQALVWAANLLHGGEAHANADRTRWSQVTHYYFEDCLYVTPFHCDPYVGKVELREVADLRTGRHVENRYAGAPLPADVRRFFGAATRSGRWRSRLAGWLSRPRVPADFDAESYLRLNPDLQASGVNPRRHYAEHGAREGRRYRE